MSLAYDRQINCNNKQDFYFILTHIAYTFSDIIDGKEVDKNIDPLIHNALSKGKRNKAIIEVVPRSWNKYDKMIWDKWNVNLNYLNTHFVIPVDQYYIDRKVDDNPKYKYSAKDPCYAYMIGQQSNGIWLIKLYFPNRDRSKKELKFVTNSNVIEGLPNLELDNYDYILITKSSKDRLSIGSHLSSHPLYGGAGAKLNIGIVNLPSESYHLKQKEYDYLKSKLDDNGMMFSLLDFDKAGRTGAKYLEETYGIPYLFITRGEFGLPNYKAKDFADLHEVYTNDQINQFIDETLTYVKLRYRQDEEGSSFRESSFLSDNLPY